MKLVGMAVLGNPPPDNSSKITRIDAIITQYRPNRVGGGVTPAVRPHHRAYGTVHGGSSGPLPTAELI